jgi:hypothetical protein
MVLPVSDTSAHLTAAERGGITRVGWSRAETIIKPNRRSSQIGVVCQLDLGGPAGRVSSVFLALRRHRVAQGPRLLGQPLDLRRSSRRLPILTTDVADGFEVGEQFVEEGEQFRQHG